MLTAPSTSFLSNLIILAVVTEQAEPAPAPLVDTAIKAATQHPDLFLVCLAVGVPLAMGLAMGYAAIKHFLPAWVAQAELNRKAADERLKAIRDDGKADADAVRALSKEQHSHIVDSIGSVVQRVTGQLEKLTDRSERHTDLLNKIAAKTGVVLLFFVVLSMLVATGRQYFSTRGERASTAQRHTCEPRCPENHYCCATRDRPNRCCPDDKTTKDKSSGDQLKLEASKPRSARSVQSFASIAAAAICDRRDSDCL